METSAFQLQQQFTVLAQQERLPHAILLAGSQEATLLSLAKQIANLAVCTDPVQKPCGHCRHCQKAMSGNHPDLLLITEEDPKRKTLSVDRIRRLREDAIIKPNEAQRKVYLLPRADTMTREAQNAFLKLLEEPPSYAMFLLLCRQAELLLPTIRSRCQCYALTEAPTFSPGSMELAAAVAKAIPAPEEAALLLASAPLCKLKDREQLQEIFSSLIWILRDSILLRNGSSALQSGQEETVRELSRAISQRQLVQCLEAVQTAQTQNSRNGNLPLLITCLCVRLRQITALPI